MKHERIAPLKLRLQAGVSPAMATPLHDDGYLVNENAVVALVDFLISRGVRGLFIGGTTGEGILLAPAERRRLHERAVAAAAGRVATLVHVGANTTAGTLELARHAQVIGADAVVAVTPYFYAMHDEALFAYFQAIAGSVPDTPLMAYDIPHMAVNAISPALLTRLAVELPTFAGLKSSRKDIQLVRQLLDAAPPEIVFLAGNESAALGCLALGADGLISGFSTAVPEPFVALVDAFSRGDLDAARRWQRAVNRILALQPAGARIGAIKSVITERGIAAGPAVPPRAMPPTGWLAWPHIQDILVEAKL